MTIVNSTQVSSTKRPSHIDFGLDATELTIICNFDERNNPDLLNKLGQYGGVDGIASLLKSDTVTGLTSRPDVNATPSRSRSIFETSETLSSKFKVVDEDIRKEKFGENKV